MHAAPETGQPEGAAQKTGGGGGGGSELEWNTPPTQHLCHSLPATDSC